MNAVVATLQRVTDQDTLLASLTTSLEMLLRVVPDSAIGVSSQSVSETLSAFLFLVTC